jgi:Tc toxin complex TcA C-terminal TcB-binding domain/Neuraminidase-like domain/Salmonella virulence plasmid 28.1kDa A protein
MRIEHEGISLWYGTPDAPAPQDVISAGQNVTVTVGVYPADASNVVEIHYRVNQGAVGTVPARYLQNGRDLRSHYFKASLPILNPGDTVDYAPVCRCAGRQVPSEAAIQEFTSSFRVVAAGVQVERERPGSEKNQPTSTPTIEKITDQITDAPKLPDASPQEVAARDQSTPTRLSARKTRHLTNLTLGISEGTRKARVEQLFTETEGEFDQLKARLAESEEFDLDTLQRLTFNHEVAELMEDRENLVAAFIQHNPTQSLRDIALNYKKQDLKAFIRTTGVPEDADVEDEEERLERFATKVSDRLFRKAPTQVIHRMVRDEEVAADDRNICHGLLSFFNSQPELDLCKTSVLQVLQNPDSLQQVPEAHREQVVGHLKKLQRLTALSPKAEAVPTLMKANLTSAYAINEIPMERFVSLYAERLGGEEVARTTYRNAENITVRNEEAYIALRQAILGAPVRMIHGESSTDARKAVYAAYAQQKNIPINFETLFGSVDLCECADCNSVYSPAAYLVELFQYLRNNNLDLDPEDPKTGVDGILNTPLEKLFRRRPDLGHLQLTCENTNTLIPYIDLVNEVMESFVTHLNAYKTDTNVPKQATITANNVDDESSGELLAEPQHTNYSAYSVLKNAVYPVCKLPYHQPIDATRQYLNYLGTSRYELFDTFRADVSFTVAENASAAEINRATRMEELQVQSVDRAIAAEYLHLTEEEYIILTKEAFHIREWYALKQEENVSEAQYLETIGLQPTWAYYGIDSEAHMLNELKWVKPEQKSGMVGFLRRVNILYVDLIALLKTQYINPNYLSGKALAYMSSLRYSYRYLQSLVDDSQTDIKLKYRDLVQFLQEHLVAEYHLIPQTPADTPTIQNLTSKTPNGGTPFLQGDLVSNSTPRFDRDYVECWVYKYFAKIGKLIVLEDASSCQCIEGLIQLAAQYYGNYADSPIEITIILVLILNLDCTIHIDDGKSQKLVGHLDTSSGRLVLDLEELFASNSAAWATDRNFLEQLLASANGIFMGKNGEHGTVKGLILYIESSLNTTHDIASSPYTCIQQETCDISKTQLKHLDGTDLVTAEYDRIHRFIRLWCKLGWTIEEVDLAIAGVGETTEKPPSGASDFSVINKFVALIPTQNVPKEDESALDFNDTFTAKPPNSNPEKDCKPEPISQVIQDITPYLIEQLVAVKKLLEITGLELAQLLTYWTPIGIYGENSLYKSLFLKYNLIATDTVFQEDQFGTYLSQEEAFSNHLPVLMAALKVDVNMIETIMSLAVIPDELTLENVSRLYRHILLAKTFGIRVMELRGVLALIQDLAQPFGEPTQTLEFYDLFARIEDSGFSPRELNYLLRDEDDPQRPLRPSMANIFQLAMGLRDALLQIEIDHADIKEDQEATEELLRSKLSLLYDGAIVEQIVTLVQGTTVYLDNTRRKFSTKLNDTDQMAITGCLLKRQKEEEKKPGGEFQTFLQRVQFSGIKGLQITGILSESDRNWVSALADLIGDADARENFLIAANKMFAQPQRFFEDALALIFVKDPTAAQEVLLATDIVNTENPEQDSGFQKRVYLIRAFMPYLREMLRQRQVVNMLSGDLGVSLDITQTLVMEVIKTQQGDPLYQEIIRLKEQKDPEEEAQRWQGFFVPEKDGKYTFLLEAEGEANLIFNNQGQWISPVLTDEEGINFYESGSISLEENPEEKRPIFLKAGQAYPFILEGYDEDENGNIMGLFMKFNNQAQVKISDKTLFPALRTEEFRKAYIQLQKAAMAVKGFDMKLAEMNFFREYPNRFEKLDFNSLTLAQWLRLEAFYRLQKSLSPSELSLVEFLRWAYQTDNAEGEPSLTAQINALTGWEESEIYKMILPNYFNLSHPEHFQDERNLLKLQETLHVAKKIGVGMGDLFKWGAPTSHFSETKKIASDIRETIRARYTQEEWEQAIKSVHDQLRENQKQALIAYLLAQPVLMEWGVRDADSLFEFFLIDVQMDACMETSRLKQALSSVQLFVQRCFLGLEAGVPSEVLDRDRWEWMSRYRVWEANRKVYLYPENWIRPELRDVKSPFFKDLESELLQNDVSQDTVKSAFTKYIVQVDEVANLDVVGQFLEGNKETGKLHVVGRTRNAPYFFYYRYYEFDNRSNQSNRYWYPWEKIEVDIPSVDVEDDINNLANNGASVIPVIWKDRLFIFFPQFMQKNWDSPLKKEMKIADSAENTASNSTPLSYWEIKMSWSEYKEEKWSPKQVSHQAIDSLVCLNRERNKDTFHLFNQPDKFKFVPFVSDSGIYFQLYYFDYQEVTEKLLNNQTSFTRGCDPIKEWKALSQSFGFNGNQISRLDVTISDRVPSRFPFLFPFLFFGWNFFQRFVTSELNPSTSILLPAQAVHSDLDPWDMNLPMFLELNGDIFFYTELNQSYSFQHDKTRDMLGLLRKGEINKIFFDQLNLLSEDFEDHYGSNNGIDSHELKRPYAIYNWEAFFHSVALLADNLSKSQRFEEAMKWWHYIFNPVAVKGDIKNVWQFLPFRVADSENVLEQIFNSLNPNTPDEGITEWRDNPFQPHVIARSRPTAYMKWVVMKYIDNLIAWGDNLFRQDTIETLNQATQLYILAGHILGPRPEIIPKRGKTQPKSYMDLVNEWDAFSNAIVDLELIFPFSNQIEAAGVFDGKPHYVNIYGFATTLYFCIPDNPKLLEYWDTVADRLFKIRHCLNIEGIFRKLSLFEPPIDPALLVQAAAQGLSISSVLNDLSTPMPNYRFNYLLQRALEVTSEVKSLGSALLSALEKKDGESLSILRAQHDTRMQNLMMKVRNKQLEEAKASLTSLEQNRKAPEYRLQYYLQLIGKKVNVPAVDAEFTVLDDPPKPEVNDDSGLKLIPFEVEEIKKAKLSADLQIAVGVVETLASILSLIPNESIFIKPFGVGAGFMIGGSDFQNSAIAVARGLQIGVNHTSFQSSAAARKAGFTRQLQDRYFQANLAGHELMQIDKQVTAQTIRRDLAQLEIDNHLCQIEQTQEVEDFIRSKYSNEQLYQWMGDQVKGLYYQAYSFAYDLAKKAEKVFRFEMGLSTSDFIKFGYWDSAKDGFLAGEQLYLALKHLENAYIETKPHDYEITRHISLQQVNPLALIQLKEVGICEFNLPEEIFDLDYPGHYKRRMKTASLSIPCIVGPYTSLNCTLRLLKHEYRNSKIANDYAKKLEEADERFVFNPIPTTAIAVSQGQNDSGVFELNFRDERYMPFEGAGAISSWRLELPQEFRQFDYQTISDVVLHLRYTSCEGGETLKTAAIDHLMEYVQNASELSQREGLFRMLSLKHEFPNEWYRFLHPEPEAESQVLVLGNLRERLPFFANNQKVSELKIQSVMLFVRIEGEELTASLLRFNQAENLDADNATLTIPLELGAPIDQLQQYEASDVGEDLDGFWALQVDQPVPLTVDMLKDAWLIIKYQFKCNCPA